MSFPIFLTSIPVIFLLSKLLMKANNCPKNTDEQQSEQLEHNDNFATDVEMGGVVTRNAGEAEGIWWTGGE